jgi:hypothetical protein
MAAMGSLHDAGFSAAFAEPHSRGVKRSSVRPVRRERKYKCARDEKLEQRTGDSCLRCGTHERVYQPLGSRCSKTQPSQPGGDQGGNPACPEWKRCCADGY